MTADERRRAVSGRACRRHGAVPRTDCDGCRLRGLAQDLADAQAKLDRCDALAEAWEANADTDQFATVSDLLMECARALRRALEVGR